MFLINVLLLQLFLVKCLFCHCIYHFDYKQQLSFRHMPPTTAGTYFNFFTEMIFKQIFFFSYLGDGRFHLEAVMIANPSTPAYVHVENLKRQISLRVPNSLALHNMQLHIISIGCSAQQLERQQIEPSLKPDFFRPLSCNSVNKNSSLFRLKNCLSLVKAYCLCGQSAIPVFSSVFPMPSLKQTPYRLVRFGLLDIVYLSGPLRHTTLN